MFASTNERFGTSYKSRIDDPKYQFAGKTGTAQVKRISKRERVILGLIIITEKCQI